MSDRRCRFCGAGLEHTFVDLGMTPLANDYLEPEDLERPEEYFPLHAFICGECLLVQLPQAVSPERLFRDYAYFSSYSESWLRHAREYVEMATRRFELGRDSLVVELASNDGYLLQYFVERGIPVLGVEPAANIARAASERGVPTRVEFFGEETARAMREEGIAADLVVANNVLAHVPDLNGFVRGIERVLDPRGVATVEFPHLLRLMANREFDTIYHEHVSYFSFLTVERIFARHGLTLFDVEELPTHGGSLRIYARHEADESREPTPRVHELRARERRQGYHRLEGYYCGIGTDFLDSVADRSPHKQGRYTPGTRIPIRAPERIAETRPDYVLILPWNLRREITAQMAYIGEWGGRFLVPIPTPFVCEPREADVPGAELTRGAA